MDAFIPALGLHLSFRKWKLVACKRIRTQLPFLDSKPYLIIMLPSSPYNLQLTSLKMPPLPAPFTAKTASRETQASALGGWNPGITDWYNRSPTESWPRWYSKRYLKFGRLVMMKAGNEEVTYTPVIFDTIYVYINIILWFLGIYNAYVCECKCLMKKHIERQSKTMKSSKIA